MESPIVIGCVEDHEPDVALLKHALSRTRIEVKSFLHTQSLRGLGELLNENPDVILLDLGLPDSQGIDTVKRAKEIVGPIPLIVLTGSEVSGLAAIAAGADDFLDKDLIGGGQLARVLGYAVERNRLRFRLDQLESERELAKISANARPPAATVTGSLLGQSSLNESAPDVFKASVDEFTAVVRGRLHANVLGQTETSDDRLRVLAERIGHRSAGPDDVVAILTEAVERQRLHVGPAQFGSFVREARVALIELMGFVLVFYRRHAPIGIARQEWRHQQPASPPRTGIVVDDNDVAVATHDEIPGKQAAETSATRQPATSEGQ